MYSIKVEGHFSAAHFLEDYDGLCGSIHGHRWQVFLSARLDKNSDSSMLVDFKDLKKTLNTLMDELDHSFIVDPEGNEASKEFYALAKKYGMRVFAFSGRTTAENLAYFIWHKIQEMTGWTTHKIEVFEAPNNSVMYWED